MLGFFSILRICSSLFLYLLSCKTFLIAIFCPVPLIWPSYTTPKVPFPAVPSISYLKTPIVVALVSVAVGGIFCCCEEC